MALLQCAQQRSGTLENVEQELKVKVREIVRAYRHSWDVYSELLQNSVDAINRRYRIMNDPDFYLYSIYRDLFPQMNADPNYSGRIEISIDATNRTIIVRDNGVGIPRDKIESFLLPEGSDKRIGHEYGFKGYGLTYVAFLSHSFRVTSRPFLPENAPYQDFALTGLFDWLSSDDGAQFPSGPVPDTRHSSVDTGSWWNTEMSVQLEPEYAVRFPAVSSAQQALELIGSPARVRAFEYVLRTRTAIGNTRILFNKKPIVPIEISLSVSFGGGIEPITVPISYSYFHPKEHEEVSSNTFDFANYVERLTIAGFNRGFSGLYHTVTGVTVGHHRPIKCDYALAAISTTRLSNIESALGFSDIEGSDMEVSYGVHLAIDGMPTGVRIDDWDRRGAYLKRYFVIVDADMDISNQLDPGRKGISKYYGLQMSDKAIELLNESKIENSDSFARYAARYLDYGQSSAPFDFTQDFQDRIKLARRRGEEQEHAEPNMIALLRNWSNLEYFPSDEQGVVALFFELLRQNAIKGYRAVYVAGSRAIYDAALEYSIECTPENIFPQDPLGVGSTFVAELKRATGKVLYAHRDRYVGHSILPELCVDFKKSVGGFLDEALVRTGTSNKHPHLLDLLITWDAEVPKSIPGVAFTLDEVIDNRRRYHGTTHRLSLMREYSTEIHCIVLRDVLTRLK